MEPLRLALSLARAVGALAAELVAPSTCAACDALVREGVLFCASCASTVERWSAPDGDAPCHAPFLYGGAVAAALARLKYAGRPDLAPRFGRALAEHLVELSSRVDVVVPVPIHRRRLATRGFDQASLVAGAVARRLGVPRDVTVLTRVRDTPAQVGLAKASRLRNVEGAFACRDATRVRGARVLVVDDVVTTGATMAACAEPLLAAGAARVIPAAVAVRTDPEGA